MNYSLAITALVMGLAGGPHCVAMCGAACAGIGQAAAPRTQVGLLLFQIGRLIGYGLLGLLAAASMQGLGWLSVHSAALRPVWVMIHAAAIVIGLALLILARQPLWLDNGARRVWARVRAGVARWGLIAPLAIGTAWALMPCGLLYSALMVAALAGRALEGAAVMLLFAVGSGITLWLGPWLLLRFGVNRSGAWGIRLAGLALVATAAWGLWMDLMRGQAPWCAVPGA
ncbi:MAG: sulfite exporter TauE/SafE family protein [Burkholderiaceae bacterium]|jgi:sulfite exporter TauE/SafE|nr:sulfite exporter TauE/SafE family protein [Burkholderiaceae bacterium]